MLNDVINNSNKAVGMYLLAWRVTMKCAQHWANICDNGSDSLHFEVFTPAALQWGLLG